MALNLNKESMKHVAFSDGSFYCDVSVMHYMFTLWLISGDIRNFVPPYSSVDNKIFDLERNSIHIVIWEK